MVLEVSTWIFWVVVTDGPMNPMKMVHFYSSGTMYLHDRRHTTGDIKIEPEEIPRRFDFEGTCAFMNKYDGWRKLDTTLCVIHIQIYTLACVLPCDLMFSLKS